MTRAELAKALRARFAERRKDFPDVVARSRYVTDERFLQGHVHCPACGGQHFTVAELVAMAEPFDDIDAFMAATEKVARQRVPKRCLRETDRIHKQIMGSRN